MELTVVLPIYNEAPSIPLLFEELVLAVQDYDYEIIAVNDGSKDQSWSELQKMSLQNNRIKLLNFRRNYGQTAALSAGIQAACGEIIVLIDSDLENDPKDIRLLVNKLNEGFDVVSGWRKGRWEGQFLTRKLPSLLANQLISKIGGVPLHDYGCTLKAYRRDIVQDVKLYGQMHRFIPVFCKWQGGSVTELPVNYRPRMFGQSNYGLFRIYKVILDLILIRFLEKFMTRPIHFFGGVGILSFLMSFFTFGVAGYFKLMGEKDFVETPLPILSAMFFTVGVLMVLLGIISEIMMRTYFESQNSAPFSIRDRVNF